MLYSILVGFFVYKELTWKGVWEALKKTLISSSSITVSYTHYQGFKYVGVAGKQISQGMEIPMMICTASCRFAASFAPSAS